MIIYSALGGSAAAFGQPIVGGVCMGVLIVVELKVVCFTKNLKSGGYGRMHVEIIQFQFCLQQVRQWRFCND